MQDGKKQGEAPLSDKQYVDFDLALEMNPDCACVDGDWLAYQVRRQIGTVQAFWRGLRKAVTACTCHRSLKANATDSELAS